MGWLFYLSKHNCITLYVLATSVQSIPFPKYMKKNICFLFFLKAFILFTSAAIAQQFTLTGKVFDKATGKTLAGASVYLPEIKKGTLTNKEGVYTMNLEQGSHVLEISYVGYATDVYNIKL